MTRNLVVVSSGISLFICIFTFSRLRRKYPATSILVLSTALPYFPARIVAISKRIASGSLSCVTTLTVVERVHGVELRYVFVDRLRAAWETRNIMSLDAARTMFGIVIRYQCCTAKRHRYRRLSAVINSSSLRRACVFYSLLSR